MARIAEYTLLARAGKEESVAATKTYTCQLLALYLLAYALGGDVASDVLRQLARLGGARCWNWKSGSARSPSATPS